MSVRNLNPAPQLASRVVHVERVVARDSNAWSRRGESQPLRVRPVKVVLLPMLLPPVQHGPDPSRLSYVLTLMVRSVVLLVTVLAMIFPCACR